MFQSRSALLFAVIACAMVAVTSAFTTTATGSLSASRSASASAPFMSFDDFGQETPEDTKERIQALVENNPVLLFMKGSKLFPQCGFSNTACQILQSYDIDFHSIDVLSDEAIRQGVKDFSMWPTIPQLYVCGEFIGGSDIMIEMYQSGELGEMIEKAKADMV
uniref:Glutaredoxin domain-containing protein n=1 Tax=Pseudo-nitzschia delicatissima TaxID=44447 RepID=A0A7S0UGD5_9STRA|mmetsp:Transcript_3364/g.6970  ORF Transcript_3364/g.6970 Transcript_3364/m.6970 type:complete len:163 (+) Transcript_3364:77-565(+)